MADHRPPVVKEWQDLAAEARQLGAVLGDGAALPAVTGTDPAEVVSVRMEPDGSFSQLTIEEGWLEEVGTDGLAGAITAALQSAATARLDAWADQLDRADAR